MCGIIGFNFENREFLNKAMSSIHHRGPDSSGVFTDKGISLGHKRLSIIDLSNNGRQPMSNEKGNIWIIFNGEIYNFQELKGELKQKHDFKSNTDTETIIHLYEEFGVDIINKLQGMFAFCIYDSKKKILFLARDRVGKKPLYYYHLGKKFIFCSEIKGILEDEGIKRQVNLNALDSFLMFRANTGEETMFNHINKLIPGSYLIYNLQSNSIEKKQYWDIQDEREYFNREVYCKELKYLLENSVKSRLMSDVPYGAYLSGGIDSGTIVSLMAKYSGKKIETFSVGFEDKEDMEISEAKFLSNHIGTNHHELLIKEDSVKNLPNIVYHSDEPMADPTAIPIYLLSKYTKKYCTVVLTGEGSDEIFAGYPQYKFMKLHRNFIRPLPTLIRKVLPNIIKVIPTKILNKGFRYASALGDKGIERFSNFVISNKYSEQYINQVGLFNKEEMKELYGFSNDIYSEYGQKYFLNTNRRNVVRNCQIMDFKGNMVDDLLMKLDKNTMAFSIEGRCPFLDYRIIELAFKMPDNLKLKGFNQDKYILRKVMGGLIPEQTRKRKKKHFFVPINKWFKNELSELKNQLLNERYINKQNIFKYSYIKKIEEGFESSKLFYSRQLWSLIVFQIWHKQFIENEKIKI
jgi:asparagine synthase (glutamine-hydrolysing)